MDSMARFGSTQAYGYVPYGQEAKPRRRRTIVSELQHVVRVRDGVVEGPLGPGRHWLSKRRDRIVTLPAVPQSQIVGGQEILTADGVTIRATVALTTQIVDPVLALRAGDWHAQLHVDVQLALRAVVTGSGLEDLVANRTVLDEPLQVAAATAAAPMGVEVTKLAVRDVVVPGEQRKLLSQIVEAKLAAQAALERARGETAALRSLSNAASLLRENPDLYRVRLLQEIANSSGNTFMIDTDPGG